MTVTQANLKDRSGAPTSTLGSSVPVIPNAPIAYFTFEGVTWDFYTQTLHALDPGGQHDRVTSNRGAREIMTVGRRHEMIEKAIGRLVEVYADENGIGIKGV